jgi:hypothetical protein
MADLPIACTLSPEALKARRENLLAALLQRSTERTELPDGLRLRFTADAQILAEIARTVDAERLCCRFLSFTISRPPCAACPQAASRSFGATLVGCRTTGPALDSDACVVV